MKIISGDRCTGKTSRLIEIQLKDLTNAMVPPVLIVVHNEALAARRRDEGVPSISFNQFLSKSDLDGDTTDYVIDDLDLCLKNLNKHIIAITTTSEVEILTSEFPSGLDMLETIKKLGVVEFNNNYPSWAIPPGGPKE